MRDQPLLAATFSFVVLCGVALRVWVASSSLGELDGDEAVVGLMARHIADGSLPTFFWGQSYGGAQEAYLAAPLLALAPTSVAALKTVPLVLHVLGGILCYLIGSRLDSRATGLVAAGLFWVWPGFFVWWSLKERGFYGATLVAGLACWWCGLRIDQDPRPLDWILLGLFAGLGWWASPQVMFLLVPVLLWLAFRRRIGVRAAIVGFAAAVAGALPWLWANARTGFPSFDIPSVPLAENTYLSRLRSFFDEALPSTIGLRVGDHWWFDAAGVAAFAVLLGALVMVLILRSHPLLWVGAAGYPFLYASSPLSQGEARYLYLLAPVLALAVALAARTAWVRVGILVLALLGTTAGLVAMDRHHISTPRAPDVLLSGDLRKLAEDLQEAGVESLYADYWVAYPLIFHSGEEVLATPFRGVVRSPEYDAAVRAAVGSRYLVAVDSLTVDIVRRAFVMGGRAFEERTFGGFLLIESDAALAPEAIPELRFPEFDYAVKAGP